MSVGCPVDKFEVALKLFSSQDKNGRTVRMSRQAQTDDPQVTVYCPSSNATAKNPGSGHLAGFTSRLKAIPWGHRWRRLKETCQSGPNKRTGPKKQTKQRAVQAKPGEDTRQDLSSCLITFSCFLK